MSKSGDDGVWPIRISAFLRYPR